MASTAGAASGASVPVHSSKARAAWPISIATPSSVVAPSGFGRGQQRGDAGAGRRCRPRGARPAGRRPGPAIPSGVGSAGHPDRGGVDHHVGRGHRCRADPVGRRPLAPTRLLDDGRPLGQGRHRLGPLGGPVGHGDAGRPRPGPRASTIERAAPTGTGDQERQSSRVATTEAGPRRRRRSRRRRSSGRRSGRPSSIRCRQLQTPRAAAAGVSSSTAPATSALWGMVTDSPSIPRVRMAATAAAPSPAGTGRAT